MPTTSLFGPIALLAHFRGQIDLTRYLVRSDGLVRGWFQRVHFSSANRGGGGGRHHRGRICVVGRAGLQAHACECYGTVKRESDRLMELSRPQCFQRERRHAGYHCSRTDRPLTSWSRHLVYDGRAYPCPSDHRSSDDPDSGHSRSPLPGGTRRGSRLRGPASRQSTSLCTASNVHGDLFMIQCRIGDLSLKGIKISKIKE